MIQGFRTVVFIFMAITRRFSRCALQPSSAVSCRTRELTRNFEPRVGPRIQQETSKEGWSTHRPKHCEYNNKYEEKTLNDKND